MGSNSKDVNLGSQHDVRHNHSQQNDDNCGSEDNVDWEDPRGDIDQENHGKFSTTTYLRIGIDFPAPPDAEILNFSNCRLAVLENLDSCINLKVLTLDSNFITKIDNLNALQSLEKLELYQNSLKRIEGLEQLQKLRLLDLSFNDIRKIENLDHLVELENLYLSSNKIQQITGLPAYRNLKLLELGSNRIRTLDGLPCFPMLEELWLGKNKLNSMALPQFPNLRILSLQSNRLTCWDVGLFTSCPNLVELYLSNNQLPDVPEDVQILARLVLLDISSNRISSLRAISKLTKLQELWMNDNSVENVKELNNLCVLTNLEALYLERNPIQMNLGPAYRTAILSVVPWIKQIDARVLQGVAKFTRSEDGA